MKINLTNILLGVLVVILVWQNFSGNRDERPPQPITITLPEKTGSTGVVEVERVVHDTVYLPSKKEYIQVDKGWKKKYEAAKTENERLKLFYESIKINKYEKTIVDNDTVTIKGKFTTRGALLDYNVDYTLHPMDFSYTPEIKYRHPNMMIGVGVETGIPTVPNSKFVLKGNLSFENSKGNNFNLGYDTEGRAWLGFTKTFKLY